jgi:hypothetical protein
MQGDGRRLVVLFAVVPNPNVLRRHPQHLRQRHPWIGPVPDDRFGSARLSLRAGR